MMKLIFHKEKPDAIEIVIEKHILSLSTRVHDQLSRGSPQKLVSSIPGNRPGRI